MILDNLTHVIAATPGLAGRADTTRIGVAGHSYGATTASALLGARVLAPTGNPDEDSTDPRVSAGAFIALAGLAGDDLTPLADQFFPFMNPSFDHLEGLALFIAGDADQSILSTRGPDWWTDAYQLTEQDKNLLTVFGSDHAFGGIHAHGTMPQTPSDNPATVALVQRTTTAYLQTALGVDAGAWMPSVLRSMAVTLRRDASTASNIPGRMVRDVPCRRAMRAVSRQSAPSDPSPVAEDALDDELAFVLRQRRHQIQHQTTGRRRRINPIRHRADPDASLPQHRHRGQHVDQRPAEPIDPPDRGSLRSLNKWRRAWQVVCH